MKYTRDDLQVLDDPVEMIRKRPQMFLKKVSGVDLATCVAGTACLTTDNPVTILHKDTWWIVACEDDWMQKEPDVGVDHLFSRMLPLPEAGPNSMRGEILLSAFASDVVTVGAGEARVIKGTVARNADVWCIIQAHPAWKRVVAFRINDGAPDWFRRNAERPEDGQAE